MALLLFTGPRAVTDRYIGTYSYYGKEFSERECEVLDDMMDGYDIDETAARLGLSAQTIKNHRSSLLAKSGAPNSWALIARYAYACAAYNLAELEHRVAMLETGSASVLASA